MRECWNKAVFFDHKSKKKEKSWNNDFFFVKCIFLNNFWTFHKWNILQKWRCLLLLKNCLNRIIFLLTTPWDYQTASIFQFNSCNKAYLNDVTDDEFSNLDLLRQASRPDDVEGLLALDSVLQSSKLFLFGPVVEGRHEDYDDDGDEDGNTLDPAVVLLLHNADWNEIQTTRISRR